MSNDIKLSNKQSQYGFTVNQILMSTGLFEYVQVSYKIESPKDIYLSAKPRYVFKENMDVEKELTDPNDLIYAIKLPEDGMIDNTEALLEKAKVDSVKIILKYVSAGRKPLSMIKKKEEAENV